MQRRAQLVHRLVGPAGLQADDAQQLRRVRVVSTTSYEPAKYGFRLRKSTRAVVDEGIRELYEIAHGGAAMIVPIARFTETIWRRTDSRQRGRLRARGSLALVNPPAAFVAAGFAPGDSC